MSARFAVPLPWTSDNRAPGVFVLGMHRSGTSVVAGILENLGLDGGDPETMFVADEFNTDGYWEQRPVVEFHDALLQRLGGYPSAPPRRSGAVRDSVRDEAAQDVCALVARLYDAPWFVKDPRQCLLLPVWSAALGASDLAVVVSRDPTDVIRSLRHRNGYSPDLAAGLWEQYTVDLLAGLAGRPCMFLQYEELLARPHEVVSDLTDALRAFVDRTIATDVSVFRSAVALVRPSGAASSTRGSVQTTELRPEHRALHDLMRSLDGCHPTFFPPAVTPQLSRRSRRLIARRRLMLRAARTLVGRDPVSRSKLDRRRH